VNPGAASRRRWFAIALAAALCVFAGAAQAHGSSVTIHDGSLEPALLQVRRGETVHFANQGERPHRVRGDGDAFRSPELAPGAGWHLPFPFAGRFEYGLEGVPDVRGVIVVE